MRRHGERLRRRLPILLVVAALPVLLGACDVPTFWGYRGVGKAEHQSFLLYVGTVFAAIVVGGLVTALILWCVVRYRRRDDEMPKQFQYHIALEWTYTVIPIVIVLILFVFTVAVENGVDAVAANPSARVEVTAFQWGWDFQYCANGGDPAAHDAQNRPTPCGKDPASEISVVGHTTDNPDLVLPTGVTAQITLVSNDVTHGFYVPQLDFSRYALPGVTNIFDFVVTKSGDYRGQCTQLCGLYHSLMFFHVTAVSPAQFRNWLQVNAGKTIQGCPDATDAAGLDSPSATVNNAVRCVGAPGGPVPTDPSYVIGVNPRS